MKTLTHIIILIIFCLITSNAYAQLSPRINMPGTLKDVNGAAVDDGEYMLEFRLYDLPVGGIPRWTETATVSVKGGLYNHLLGSITPLSADLFDVTLFLGVKLGAFELQPRTELTYAPYTFASAMSLYANKVICSGAIGDIKYSILNPTQFAAKNGDCWVPMDGTDRPGSRLANMLGTANVAPDASGMFMRGHEYNEGQDPDRLPASPVATIQDESIFSHTHTPSLSAAGGHSHPYTDRTLANNSSGFDPRYTSGESAFVLKSKLVGGERNTSFEGAHTHALNIDNTGGAETRPKNLNLYVYIRVN